ncbi:MAG: hypothetical protein NT001_05850, partial [Candidatus Woesearchaeota archaeon]|nr:hypothetical protein [Candidatus Woesearchaeota archaeon]
KLIVSSQNADNRDYNVSFAKSSRVLCFRPSMTMENAIKEMKEAIASGRIKDYKEKRYSNYSWFKDR